MLDPLCWKTIYRARWSKRRSLPRQLKSRKLENFRSMAENISRQPTHFVPSFRSLESAFWPGPSGADILAARHRNWRNCVSNDRGGSRTEVS